MITNEKIAEIITKMADSGYSVRVGDVAYVLLCRNFDDSQVAYKALFGDGSDAEISLYSKSKAIVALTKCMKEMFVWDSKEDITFEENKAYMLKLKRDTEKAMADGDIDKKDGLKILTDISTKLNDKFGAKEEMKDQIVVVNCKYNSICECGKEIYIPTKEDLMKQYNLVEKN